ncbi:HAMP domain-containing sensor histidine kinase [Pollutimonas bauzanensis]|uniref:histidine kinase n=1 Tax=Pollutimonas bauzanensis TaxID=658167 RepID=A0A1M5WBR7_9BURK|nr:HAMP domain-containing sensor histidine kinase [Pollutimonas bauzanensis]SHH84644.1 Signal transduction histidine kinase [Pollutimonas bauzanensis]
MKSIGRRIYRAILAISLSSMAVMVATVLIVNEDLEDTMLQVEFTEERDVFLQHRPGPDLLVWETANLAVAHIPQGAAMPSNMPAIFSNLPANFSGELERDGKTFLVRVEPSPTGVFYIAKNITHFEDRESLFQIALAVVVLLILGLSLVLAALSSRRIVNPLRRLSDQISDIPVGASMPRIPLDYQDSELHTIALTFNRFLDELESFVKREQSLLNLASHELRTPIAVVSGALDVLEQRRQLNENDQATLARIRRACSEMGANVDMLLKLARREPGEEKQPLALAQLVEQALEDLEASQDMHARVTVSSRQSATVLAEPTIVRMLLRNLIQNALQHTTRGIQIRLRPGSIEIADEGPGMSAGQQAILAGQKRMNQDGAPLSGLGLYIVTLMCERLKWRLEVVRSGSRGTVIRLHTAPA